MQNTSIVVASIIGLAIVISSYLLSSAIESYGRSLERAAQLQQNVVNIPSHFTVRAEGGNSPLRLDVTNNK